MEILIQRTDKIEIHKLKNASVKMHFIEFMKAKILTISFLEFLLQRSIFLQ